MHSCMDPGQRCADRPQGARHPCRVRGRSPMSAAIIRTVELESRGPVASRAAAARWTLIATSFGLGMALLDMTAVNVAVPSIQSGLHTDVLGLSWVIDGYTLTFA